MSLSDDTTMEVLSGLRRRVDVDAASRLRLDDDIVYTVVFRRLHDGVPFVLTGVHLPDRWPSRCSASPELADGAVGTNTVIGLLEPHLRRADRRSGAVDYGRSGRRRRRRRGGVRARAPDAAGGPAVLRRVRHGPSSWRSATSCPSSTPTGSRCAGRAERADRSRWTIRADAEVSASDGAGRVVLVSLMSPDRDVVGQQAFDRERTCGRSRGPRIPNMWRRCRWCCRPRGSGRRRRSAFRRRGPHT